MLKALGSWLGPAATQECPPLLVGDWEEGGGDARGQGGNRVPEGVLYKEFRVQRYSGDTAGIYTGLAVDLITSRVRLINPLQGQFESETQNLVKLGTLCVTRHGPG